MSVIEVSPYYKEALNKLEKKDSIVAVIGLGYVGLPLALTFSETNYKVVGIDINKEKIDSLINGKSYISYISNKRIINSNLNCTFTSDFKLIRNVDAIIICVPTPLSKHREPDLSYVLKTFEHTIPYIHRGQIISLESTTFPGTTDEIIRPILEKRNFKIGHDLFLIYSPERDDPGNKTFNIKNTPKILGGCSSLCKNLGYLLYKYIVDDIVLVSSTKTAEMTKLVENIQRAVNIGLVNELKVLADKMGIDLFEVIKAASTKPFGFTPFFPGPGLGGHCIPIDPFYLTWKVKQYDLQTRFIELAGEINSSMPKYVFDKTIFGLNEKCKSIKNSKIIVLGLSYKKNIEDQRESPSILILEMLIKNGAKVSYSDPFLPKYNDLQSITLTKEVLLDSDVTILLTDHDSFDYELIKNYSNMIIDTRGRYETSEKIIRA